MKLIIQIPSFTHTHTHTHTHKKNLKFGRPLFMFWWYFSFFFALSLFFSICDVLKEVKMPKKTIFISKRHAEDPLTGQNTQKPSMSDI